MADFKLVCDACHSNAEECYHCEHNLCSNCDGDIIWGDWGLYCDVGCVDASGAIYCTQGEVHDNADAEVLECEYCAVDFCTLCEMEPIKINDAVFCGESCRVGFFKDDDENEEVTLTPIASNSSSPHVATVNGKEQCFCNDPDKKGEGHLPGGIWCRL